MSDGDHYEAEVNRDDINMGHFTRQLNDRWKDGWKLAHVFVHKDTDTVMVWEKRTQ